MKLKDLFENKAAHDENSDMGKTPPIGKLGDMISSAQAAKILGVTMSRIRQFVMDGRLKSYAPPTKGHRDHLFKLSAVRAFARKDREITGRPPEHESTKDKDDKKD